MSRLLAIYLNDHLAAATAGLELARRALSENRGNEYGQFLSALTEEVAEDRRTLIEVMQRLRVPRSRVKVQAAWALEKLGRLKLNGSFRGYSPLSRLLELEGLAAGLEAKRMLWLTLLQTSGDDDRLGPFDLDALAARADDQRRRLEPHRSSAAREAMSGA